MYLSEVSVRHLEKLSSARGKYNYVYMEGIYLKQNWGGEYKNVAVLVVNGDGYRNALGAAEGTKEDLPLDAMP